MQDTINQSLDHFLSHFFPDEHESIHLCALPPKDGPGYPEMLVSSRRELRDERTIVRLREMNKTRGIFARPNSGGHNDNEITRFNALFVERDTISLPKQHKLLDKYHPHVRVDTLKSVHAYWLLGPNDLSSGAWRHLQRELIARFKSDPAIENPARLMRLPFFDYVIWSPIKNGTFSNMRLQSVSYDNTFPPIAGLDDYQRIFGDDLRAINDAMIAGIKEPIDPSAEVHEGGRNMALFRLVCSLRARGVSHDVIRETAIDYNGQKIKPSLDDVERDRVIDQGLSYDNR